MGGKKKKKKVEKVVRRVESAIKKSKKSLEKADSAVNASDDLLREAEAAVDEFTAEHVMEVQGFEIPLQLATELTDDAVFILGHVKRNGVAVFETDDSEEDFKTVEQLRRIAEEEYFSLCSERDGHKHIIVDDGKRFFVKMSH